MALQDVAETERGSQTTSILKGSEYDDLKVFSRLCRDFNDFQLFEQHGGYEDMPTRYGDSLAAPFDRLRNSVFMKVFPEHSGSAVPRRYEGKPLWQAILTKETGKNIEDLSALDVGGPGVVASRIGIGNNNSYFITASVLSGEQFGTGIFKNFYTNEAWKELKGKKFSLTTVLPVGPWMEIDEEAKNNYDRMLPYAIGVIVNALNATENQGISVFQVPSFENQEKTAVLLTHIIKSLEGIKGFKILANLKESSPAPAIVLKKETEDNITIDDLMKDLNLTSKESH